MVVFVELAVVSSPALEPRLVLKALLRSQWSNMEAQVKHQHHVEIYLR